MITAKQQTWHDIEIPPFLEMVGGKSTRHLNLRLADLHQRREWEMYFDVSRTPKTISGSLFIMPWRYLDDRKADLTNVQAVAVGLIHKRASVSSGGCSISFRGFHHTEGTIVFRAMLEAVERHLEKYQT